MWTTNGTIKRVVFINAIFLVVVISLLLALRRRSCAQCIHDDLGGEAEAKAATISGSQGEFSQRFSDPWGVFNAGASEKFTIVVQTYKRTDLLNSVLSHYSSFKKVDKILVVWNNIGSQPPANLMSGALTRTFLLQKVNNVRNRLQPFPDIQTPGMPLLIHTCMYISSVILLPIKYTSWLRL